MDYEELERLRSAVFAAEDRESKAQRDVIAAEAEAQAAFQHLRGTQQKLRDLIQSRP